MDEIQTHSKYRAKEYYDNTIRTIVMVGLGTNPTDIYIETIIVANHD